MPILAINIFKNSAAAAKTCICVTWICAGSQCTKSESRFAFFVLFAFCHHRLSRRDTNQPKLYCVHRFVWFWRCPPPLATKVPHSIIPRTSFLILASALPHRIAPIWPAEDSDLSFSRHVYATAFSAHQMNRRKKNSCRNAFNFSFIDIRASVCVRVYLGMLIFNTLRVHRTKHENGNDTSSRKEKKKKLHDEPGEEKNKKCHRRWVLHHLCYSLLKMKWKRPIMRSNLPCAGFSV